jgi:O-antigen/teichoic acid export membrane protein
MDESKKSGIKNIGIIGFANIFGAIISAVFWLSLANLMGEENYGELGFLIGVGSISIAIAIWGSEKALTVFTAKNINIQPPIYIISFITSGLTALALYFLLDSIGLSVFVVGAVIYNLTIAEIIGRKQFKKYAKIVLSQKILFVSLGILFYYIIGHHGILLGFGLSCFPFIYIMYNTIKRNKVDFKILKEKAGFITNNYISDLIIQSGGQIDKILIGPIFGFALLGNYYFGIQIFNILTIVPEIVFRYTLTEDSSGVSTKQIKILTVIGSVFLALIGIFFVPILISEFFTDFKESLEFVPIISLAVIPATISSMYMSKFLGNEQSKIVMIGAIIGIIIFVPGIIILGEIMGITGLAIIFVVTETVKASFFVITDIYLRKRESFL